MKKTEKIKCNKIKSFFFNLRFFFVKPAQAPYLDRALIVPNWQSIKPHNVKKKDHR